MSALQVYDYRSTTGMSGLGGQLSGGAGQLYLPPSPRLNPFELVIEKYGNQLKIDYGSELRLLIADPIKGIDLREAISKLKEALLV
jgi:hypothetical protein